MAWRSLLSGALRAEALSAVGEIAADLGASNGELDGSLDGSLASGHAGLALFHGQLAVSGLGADAPRLAAQHLDRALEIAASAAPSSLGFFNGLSGLAWVMHHLGDVVSGSPSPAITEDLDAAIGSALRADEWSWELDHTYGISGIGCYLLDHPDRTLAAELLTLVCRILGQRAEDGSGGVCWRTPARFRTAYRDRRSPTGDLDLGLAHGLPGIIAMLGRAAGEHDLAAARALRDRAAAWLRGQATLGGSGGTGLPFFHGESRAARSAWCYGNPGAAAGILTSFSSTGDREARSWAIEMALAESRRPAAETGVVDATLCHGAAGLGHIYNRLYQQCGREELADAARYWLATALEMRRPGGIGRFMNWWPEAEQWHGEAGILVGAGGIGLALLAAASDAEPAWDRILLLSHR
jgi:lantibiotic modifying enzyme